MSFVSPQRIKDLEMKANEARMLVIDMLEDAGSGHTAGPLGMADIFTALYFHSAKHDIHNPDWEDRDRIILSNGHIVPIRYAVMALVGYFPIEELKTLRKFGSRLQGHPERSKILALETTSGPLGSGLSQAAGIAYAGKIDNKKFTTFCLMSDGEMQVGNIWEAAMFAGKNKLSNLIGIIDRNNIQINGMTEDVMPIEPLRNKWESFNWHVIEVNGNNIEEIIYAIDTARAIYEKPIMIIAHTIPGKGIKEIEFDYTWHGKPPNKEEEKRFLSELRTLRGKIQSSDHE